MGTKILSLLILATKFNALGCDNGNKIQQKIHIKNIAPHFKFFANNLLQWYWRSLKLIYMVNKVILKMLIKITI